MLTVTDSNGLSATTSRSVNVTGPNAAPNAVISTSASGLTVTADGSGSSDDDGQIVSYDWDWGDGETSSGQVSTHSYAEAGDYTVTLTVTDDRDGTSQATETVSLSHTDPTAEFTASTTGMTVSVDAAASHAENGATLSYSWDWGDGTAAGEGVAATHTYLESGDYDITLTVTDSLGAEAEVSRSVSVSDAEESFLASDSFERTVGSGWGTADVGGAWSATGFGTAAVSVGDGVGSVALAPGAARDMRLASVSAVDSTTSMRYSLESGPSTGALYVGMKLRYDDSAHAYRSLVWHRDNGSTWLVIQRDGTVLATLPLSGQWAAGDSFMVRSEVVGEDSPTIRMKVWRDGEAEPAAWQLETTDSSASALTGAGAGTVYVYRSGSSSGQQTVRIDDYRVVGPDDDSPAEQRIAADQNAESDSEEPTRSEEAAEPSEKAQDGPGAPEAPAVEDDAETEAAASEDADTQAAEPSEPKTGAEPAEEGTSDAETEPGSSEELPLPDTRDPDAEADPSRDTDPGDQDAADTSERDPADDVDEAPGRSGLEDRFERAIESGWGASDHGGAWTLADGSDAELSVTDGAGRMEIASGSTADVLLEEAGPTASSSELSFRFDGSTEPDGTEIGILYGTADELSYSVRASQRVDGSTWITVRKGEETLAEEEIEDMASEPGVAYILAVSVGEQDETALQAKLWRSSDEEPAQWQLEVAQDELAPLPDSGVIGVTAARSGEATDAGRVAVEELVVSPQE
jgi:PKD repeat protein